MCERRPQVPTSSRRSNRDKDSGKTGKTGSDTGNRCNERQLLYQGKWDRPFPVVSTEFQNPWMVSFSGSRRRRLRSPKPAHTYYITLRVKATDNSFASKPAERLSVTTPDIITDRRLAGTVSFEAKGTYGQTLDQIPVQLAEGFQVVNYSGSPVSGTWSFSENQKGTPASSIYPEVKGTTAYQVEFIPDWSIGRAVWRNFDPRV